MLNSFFNLCRICPSMPTEKLNSEYKTHFKWHDTYHAPIQEAIKKTVETAVTFEPALSRKKKYPQLAYKSHQVLKMVKGNETDTAFDTLETLALSNKYAVDNRARSEERSKGKNRGSLRSRSVDPYLGRRPPTTTFMTQSYPPAKHPPIAEVIPKTTEYRSQFAWPPYSVESTPRRDKKTPAKSSTPRKSVSMGAIQAVQEPPVKSVKHPAGGEAIEDEVTIKSPTNEEILKTLEEQIIETKDDLAVDVDTNIALEEASSRPKKFKTEYKARFKAPSKYVFVDGNWLKNKEYQPLHAEAAIKAADDIPVSWYGEVLELRKKAGEYKLRSWGTTITSDNPDQIFSRQKKVWEEVSQRSSLSALALAATPRETEKKEKAQKEKENMQQMGRQRVKPRAQSAIRADRVPVSRQTEAKASHARRRPTNSRTIPRSTKPEVDSARGRVPTRHHLERTTPSEGTLLTSPTRDHKLEPAQIQKDREPKTSPAKSKPSPKSSPGLVSGRSASVGPEGRSPKHTPRMVSSGPPSARTQANGAHAEEPSKRVDIKRPRPTSLSTTARSKSAVSSRGKDIVDGDGLPKMHTAGRSKAKTAAPPPAPSVAAPAKEAKVKKAEKQPEREVVLVNGEDVSSSKEELTSPQEQLAKDKLTEFIPVVKSPPEPTRVKSPEQIIVNSPEPVKWTVPLDTGIKWTGTLQIDGDGIGKSKKDEDFDKSLKDIESLGKSVKESTFPEVIQQTILPTDSDVDAPEQSASHDAPQEPQPLLTPSPSASHPLATDIFEKAHTRFDQFWGKPKEN